MNLPEREQQLFRITSQGNFMSNHTIDTWHQLLKTRDANGLTALLANDVVFHSPVMHTPQLGKTLTTMYLTAAFHVFVNDTFRYVREVIGENDAVLEFSVVIDGVTVNGVDMIRWNSEGQIIDFKVMLRPVMAITLIQQKMTAMLKASRN
jgi:ketosteroid isomerase-like protein